MTTKSVRTRRPDKPIYVVKHMRNRNEKSPNIDISANDEEEEKTNHSDVEQSNSVKKDINFKIEATAEKNSVDETSKVIANATNIDIVENDEKEEKTNHSDIVQNSSLKKDMKLKIEIMNEEHSTEEVGKVIATSSNIDIFENNEKEENMNHSVIAQNSSLNKDLKLKIETMTEDSSVDEADKFIANSTNNIFTNDKNEKKGNYSNVVQCNSVKKGSKLELEIMAEAISTNIVNEVIVNPNCVNYHQFPLNDIIEKPNSSSDFSMIAGKGLPRDLYKKANNMSNDILKNVYQVLRDSSLLLMKSQIRSPPLRDNSIHFHMLPGIATNLVNTAIENAMEIFRASKKWDNNSKCEKTCTDIHVVNEENDHLIKNYCQSNTDLLAHNLIKQNVILESELKQVKSNNEQSGTKNLCIDLSSNLAPNKSKIEDNVTSKGINEKLCEVSNAKKYKNELKIETAEISPVNKKKKKKKKANQKTVNLPISKNMKKKRDEKEVLMTSKTKDEKKINCEPNNTQYSESKVNDKEEKCNELMVDQKEVNHICEGNDVTLSDEELQDWEMNWTEDGECINKEKLNELSVQNETSTPKLEVNDVIDYLDFKPKDIELDIGEFGHILELYDFTSNMRSRDLYAALNSAGIDDYSITWVDDSHALVVFASQGAAHNAMKAYSPILKMRQVINGSMQSRMKARDCKETLLPYKKRPVFTAMVARNLVAGSLGIRPSVTIEQRRKERALLQKAKEEKRMNAKQKVDMWESSD